MLPTATLYWILGAELLIIGCASAALSHRHIRSRQHPSLRLVSTMAWSWRPLSVGRTGVWALLAFRASCAALFAGTLMVVVEENPRGAHPFFFFTTWNFCLQLVYFCLASIAGARLLCKPPWALLESPAERALSSTVHMLFSVCLPSSLLVSVVLWGVLLPQSIASGDEQAVAHTLSPSSFVQHAVNTALLLLDFSANHMLVDPSTLVLVVLWNTVYVLFEWCAHAVNGWWTYFFLRISDATPMWYAALALVGVGAHALTVGLSKLKAWRLHLAHEATETSALNPLTQPASGRDPGSELENSSADYTEI